MLQKELAKRLRGRFETEMNSDGWLAVSSDGMPLCRVANVCIGKIPITVMATKNTAKNFVYHFLFFIFTTPHFVIDNKSTGKIMYL